MGLPSPPAIGAIPMILNPRTMRASALLALACAVPAGDALS